MRLQTFAAVGGLLVSFATVASAQDLATATLAETVSSTDGSVQGRLFMPMKALLPSFPIGFSFCAEGVDGESTYAMTPVPAAAPAVLFAGSCMVVNYVTLREATDLTVTTQKGQSFQISLKPQASFVSRDNAFRPLRTDGQRFVTLTLSTPSPSPASGALYCSNRADEPVVSIETRPLGSRAPFETVAFSAVDAHCSRIAAFPWKQGAWETYFTLRGGERIRYVETVLP